MDKVTVITGGTSGIGRGIAEKILEHSEENDLIFISYGHNREQAEAFLHSLNPDDQKKVCLIQADMSSYEAMLGFVEQIKEQAGHVDWLVNNVGISTYAKYEDYTFEEWTKIVNTNLSVPVFLVKELRPVMREGGSILSGLWRDEICHPFSHQIPGKRTGTKADPGKRHCPWFY